MKYSLFSQVALAQDLPEYNLKKGAIGTVVEHYPKIEEYVDFLAQKETAEQTSVRSA